MKLFLFIPLNYFSVYSLIPNKDAIAREEYSRPLKTKYIPNLKRDLKPGWLFPHLYNHDALLHGRWEYWHRLQLVPAEKFHLLQEPDPKIRLEGIQEHILPKEPIPPINFCEGLSSHSKGRKMLEICLDKMLRAGDYTSMLTRIEYFLDWMLYGFGHPHPWFTQLPVEPNGCEGCSMVFYQLFNLFHLLYQPQDYWGSLIVEAKGKGSQKYTGYFPTPNTVAVAMAKMLFSDDRDTRLQMGYEPAIGTGVMTLEPSNHILNMVGTDIDKLLLKACLVNWYLYCPWFAMPIFYLADRVDLLWGNSLVRSDHPNAPKSIHQKYWREKYQDIYPVNLLERDWSNEVQKIIDLQSARVKAPEIANQESNFEFTEQKPKGFKRPSGKRQL
ncbi:MAG: hypothetical protein RLZZ04_1955 [Cyanobacteriota bacterium]